MLCSKKKQGKNCKYYPCHFEGQSCDFCYCPLYPCKDTRLGKWHKGVWDCSDCLIIHDEGFVSLIKNYMSYFLKIKSKA